MKKFSRLVALLMVMLMVCVFNGCSNDSSSNDNNNSTQIKDDSSDPFFGTSWYQNGKKVLEFKINDKYGVKQCYCYEEITTDKNKCMSPFKSSAYTVTSDGTAYTVSFITPYKFTISSKDTTTGSFTYKLEDLGTGILTRQ